jgi:ribosomal protein L37AE/L43A
MEPVRKELTCPSCGKTAEVRVIPGGIEHRWQCPHCKKLQTSEPAAVDGAPAR